MGGISGRGNQMPKRHRGETKSEQCSGASEDSVWPGTELRCYYIKKGLKFRFYPFSSGVGETLKQQIALD